MADNIKVAVRVRPFNKRELGKQCSCVVAMQGNQTTLTNPENADDVRTFTFDHSFWSHDDSPNAVGQDDIFQTLGVEYVNNCWEGFNCCLFAYGQTGSGKSYSMMGAPSSPGIIPLGCRELFRRISEADPSAMEFEVEVSYLEIYNERLRDLFNPHEAKLAIRESRQRGVYVSNLTAVTVQSYEEIERWMDKGNENRTVAQTRMNAVSSRSHSVFVVQLKQAKIDAATQSKTEMASKVNLVDLAGSERQTKTHATGARLKEACSINKSLLALGNVISALAESAEGRRRFIPYRDSVLTRLLQESLGGNSKTIMIAALSPASDNYDETLSTLRYADRAKRIVNNAVVNMSPSDKLIADLRAEIERLQGLLAGRAPPSIEPSPEAAAASDAERARLQEDLDESVRLMGEVSGSYEEKLARAGQQYQALQAELSRTGLGVEAGCPALLNLSEDPLLTGRLAYALRDGETTIGAADQARIQLHGPAIRAQHCVLRVVEAAQGAPGSALFAVTIAAAQGAKVFANGDPVGTTPRALGHNDRVILGTAHVFRLHLPHEGTEVPGAAAEGEGEGEGEGEATWEHAVEEFVKKQVPHVGQLESRVEALREDIRRQRSDAVRRRFKFAALRAVASERSRGESLVSQFQLAASQVARESMYQVARMVAEANDLAAEVRRPVRYAVFMDANSDPALGIQVVDTDADTSCVWTPDKMIERLVLMRLCVEAAHGGATGVPIQFDEEDVIEDPFSDPPSDVLLGTAAVFVNAFSFARSWSQAIVSVPSSVEGEASGAGAPVGWIRVALRPVDPEPSLEMHRPEDVPAHDPHAANLIGRDVVLELFMERMHGLSPEYSSVWVQYDWEDGVHESGRRVIEAGAADLLYRHTLAFRPLTQKTLDVLRETPLRVLVWARPIGISPQVRATLTRLSNELQGAQAQIVELQQEVAQAQRTQGDIAALRTQIAQQQTEIQGQQAEIRRLQERSGCCRVM